MHIYEVRPRKDKRGVNALPFGRLWYANQLHNNQEPHGGMGPIVWLSLSIRY